MMIQFKKGKNGKCSLRCKRKDGTEDWSYYSDYFIQHDLIHFIVETELCLKQGLYGHIRNGISMKTLASSSVTQAHNWHEQIFWSEAIVNSLTREISIGDLNGDIGAINALICKSCEGLRNPPPQLRAEQLTLLIGKIQEAQQTWASLEPGNSLEYFFE